LTSAGGFRGADRPFVACFPYAALWIGATIGVASLTQGPIYGIALAVALSQGVIYGIALAVASIQVRAWFLVVALAIGHVTAAVTSLKLCASVSAYC
jgi:hypothetical protein